MGRHTPTHFPHTHPAIEQLAGLGTWQWEASIQRFSCSPYLLHLWSEETAPASPEQFWACIHPDDQPSVLPQLRHALAYLTPCVVRYRWGSDRWIQETVAPLPDAEYETMVGIVQEVEAPTGAAGSAGDQRASFRRMAEMSAIGIAVHEGDRVAYVNPALARMLGCEAEALVGASLQEFIAPSDLDAVTARIGRLMAGEDALPEAPVTLRRADGATVVAAVSGVIVSREEVPTIHVMVRDLTELEAARQAAQHRGRHLQLAYEFMGMGSWELDLGTQQLWVSDSFYRLFDLDPKQDTVDLPFLLRLLPGPQITQLAQRIQRGEPGSLVEFDHTYKTQTGRDRHFHVAGRIFREEGYADRVVGIIQNVTWYREVDRRLQASESRLRLAIKGGGLGVWDWDIPSGKVIFDEGWASMLGMTLGEIPGHVDSWAKRVHPEDKAFVEARLEAHLAGDTPLYECEHRVQRADGSWCWILDRGEVVARDEADKPIRMVGIHMDITRQKETEAQLRRSEAHLEALLDAANELFFLTGPGLQVIKANKGFWQWLGRTGQATEGPPSLLNFFPEADHADIRLVMAQAWSGYPVSCSRHIRLFDQKELSTVSCHHVPVRDDQGQVFAVASSLVDITGKLQAQQQLRALSERLRLAVDAGKIGVWDADFREKKTVWDEGMAAIYGIDLAAFDTYFDAWLQYVHPEDRAQLYANNEILAKHPEQASLRQTFRIIRPDGAVRHILSLAHIHRNTDHEIVRMVGINWDETDKVVAEQQLRALNGKLEQVVDTRTSELRHSNAELEHFAYSVSHDLRTPLRHLMSFSRLLHQRAASTLAGEHRELLDFIYQAAEKMYRQIEDLLAYSRIGRREIAPTWVPLAPVLRTLWESLIGSQPDPARATLEMGELSPVFADPMLLHQALQNLLSNALKYSAAKDRIPVRVWTEQQPDGVVVAVQDEGIGFEMQHHDRIFTVFQRLHTDAEYEGNGIGLANVQRITKRHRGRVWAESVPDEGSTFFLFFPNPTPDA